MSASEAVVKSRYPSYPEPSTQSGPRARLTSTGHSAPSSTVVSLIPSGIDAPVGLGEAVDFPSLMPTWAGFDAASSELLTLIAEHPPSSRLSAAAPATNGLIFIVCLRSLPTLPIIVPTQLVPPSPGGSRDGHIAWRHD